MKPAKRLPTVSHANVQKMMKQLYDAGDCAAELNRIVDENPALAEIAHGLMIAPCNDSIIDEGVLETKLKMLLAWTYRALTLQVWEDSFRAEYVEKLVAQSRLEIPRPFLGAIVLSAWHLGWMALGALAAWLMFFR